MFSTLFRKKERKAEAQTILELKALESTATATTPSNSETPQPDVYSTPIPKVLRQPQQPVSDDHVQPNSGDNSYYHHLHQTNINKAIPGESRNPYGRLHTPDLYDHTADSETHQTGDTYDHFDSDRNDSLDKDCKGINPDSCDSQRSHQYPDVYEYTTGAVCPHDHEAYNRVQADETNSLHNEDNDNINNEYMTMTSNNGSNENSTKDTRNTENYLTPIGEHLNNTMGHTNTADIEEKRSNETDGYDEEVNIEDDTYYNVSDDKTDEQTADSDQHLYEIEDTGQVYDNLNN